MIAAGYLANGVKTYISSRKADVCEATAQRLMETYGGECIALPADLSTLDGIDGLVAELTQREDHLDLLVNNAGAAWGAPMEEFPETGWDKVMDTNVKAVFFLTQRLMPLLEAAASPENPARVINIGSIDGIKTPSLMTYSYTAPPRPHSPTTPGCPRWTCARGSGSTRSRRGRSPPRHWTSSRPTTSCASRWKR